MEIIISSILLTFIVAGLMGILISTKRRILMSQSRIAGLELGRVFIDPLQEFVRGNDWDAGTNGLCWGGAACSGIFDAGEQATKSYCDSESLHSGQQNPACPQGTDRTIDGIEYSAAYTVTQPFPNIRRVAAKVVWQPRQ